MLLPVGTEDFRRIIDSKLDFVDKTLFIKAIFDDRANDKLVFTRPRRFGKTFNLSMLHHFLAKEVNDQSTQGLFDNLKISQCGEAYMRHQGQYPVIAMTFKDIKQNSFEEAYEKVLELFITIYDEHNYLLTSQRVTDTQKRFVDSMLNRNIKKVQLENALRMLTSCLFKHHGVKPWLLIDEYDTPIQSAYVKGYYDEMIDFMRGLMGASLKTNPYIEKAVITGILRVAKESLFSEVNNLEVYSILSEQYSEYFGFTEAEVNDILEEAKLTTQQQAIKTWFNGYQFGDTVIYNPWSIAKCIKEKGATKPYWVNTSDNQLIKDLLKTSPLFFKKEFESIIGGASIEKLIDENMVFQYLNNNPTSVWNLLLMGGYLRVISCRETYQGIFAKLVIPNQEIRNLYYQIVEQWLSNGYGVEWYNEFLRALLVGNMHEFKNHLEKVIIQITSYHDFAKEPEAFYQGLMLGFTASLHSEGNYEIKSNREAGLGRFDIMLIPKDTAKLGIIIELKAAKENEALAEAAKAALEQIHAKKYAAEMHLRNITQSLKIGIGFRGKAFELLSST